MQMEMENADGELHHHLVGKVIGALILSGELLAAP